MKTDPLNNKDNDFSLILGGPLFQLFRKIHLSDNYLGLMKRRVIIITLITWLPLFVLSALDGKLLGGSISVPFLMDIDNHIRYLLVVPLLISAELFVHMRMQFLLSQFKDRNLIPESSMAKFDSAISSSMKLRNSVTAEILIILFVYIVGILIIWKKYVVLNIGTWYMTSNDGESKLSMAGIWLGYVSLPIFQFILLRWYYRLLIWIRFLWKVSRIKLNIISLHPDRVGGLGFLSLTVFAFIPLVVAHGALLVGLISNRIFYLGDKLPDFKVEIAVIILFMLFLVLIPLLVFSSQLADAKRKGKRLYGKVSMDYVREFEYKWLLGKAPKDEALIGSADIQSLADLGNSYEILNEMRVIPFSKESILQIIVAVLIPILPLTLTMMPLEELLKKLISVFF